MRRKVIMWVLCLAAVFAMWPVFTTRAKAVESWLWPAENCYIISSNFGLRDLNGNGVYDNYHHGIDIVASSGTTGRPVRAAKSGTIYSGQNTIANNTFISNSMGNYTMIDHGDGTYSVYMHMQPGNKINGYVKQGDEIGKIGCTGEAYGAHLHFEIYTDPNHRKTTNMNTMPTNTNIIINNKYVLPDGWASEKTTYIFEVPTSTPSTPNITISGQNAPTTLNIGQNFGIRGEVSTDCGVITKIDGYILNSSGDAVQKSNRTPNAPKVNLQNTINNDLIFNTLSEGNYTYRVEATAVNGSKSASKRLINQSFTVGNATPNPVPPNTPTVGVTGHSVTVSWNDVANETGYDVFLIQDPWGWEDVKYDAHVGANVTSYTFTNVADGYYNAFVISRPNPSDVQSNWVDVVVTSIKPAAPQITVNRDYLSVGDTVKISWPSVPGALNYDYYVTEFPEGYAYSDSIKTRNTEATSISFSDLPAGK